MTITRMHNVRFRLWLLKNRRFNSFEFLGEANKAINDYKYRLQKAEQEIASLQATLARSETQVIRYKSTAEAAEKAEADLKIERRKLQREVSCGMNRSLLRLPAEIFLTRVNNCELSLSRLEALLLLNPHRSSFCSILFVFLLLFHWT